MKQIFVCNDTITGIFSAIYDAWKTPILPGEIDCAERDENQELFCEYTESAESEKKAIAVENMIKKNLGMEVYRNIYYAILKRGWEEVECSSGKWFREARRIHERNRRLVSICSACYMKSTEPKRTCRQKQLFCREFIHIF